MIENVPVKTVWEALSTQPGAVLCDVRTDVEWQQIGVPDLSAIGKQTLLVSWQVAPTMQPNSQFLVQLAASGVTHATPIYFMCRSGARSLAAAEAAHAAGYRAVFNAAEGFEGRPGAYLGWAAQGLPTSR